MSGNATNQDFALGSGETGCATGSVMRNRDTPFFEEICKIELMPITPRHFQAPRRLSIEPQ
jgi:hypothetical protein